MSIRSTEITGILTRWLERYSPPANIRDKPRAQQDEAEALLSVLMRFAPQAEYVPWVEKALDQLEYQMKTRAWPTKGELGSVCSNLRKETRQQVTDATQPDRDPASVAARRMEAGEPVGEGWLYGIEACELIAKGLVSEDRMRAYRSAMFHARKSTYGEAAALSWEADAKAQHEAAKAVWRARGEAATGQSADIPDKTSKPNWGNAA